MMKFTSYLSIGAFYSKNSSLNILKREKSFITQKQTPEVFCKNRCSYKFCKIHGKTPVLESFLKKVAKFQGCNFTEKRLQHRCIPAKCSCEICEIFKNTYFEEICDLLLLIIVLLISCWV